MTPDESPERRAALEEPPPTASRRRSRSAPMDTDGCAALSELIRDGRTLEEHVAELAHRVLFDGRHEAGMRLLGSGVDQIVHGLAGVEPMARRAVESVQPTLMFDPHHPASPLDEATVARGVRMRFIVSERAYAMNPLLVAMFPHARIGPAVARFILVDRRVAVVGGPPDPGGYPTAWLATRDDVVEPLRDLWHRIWERSAPVLGPGEQPPVTRRQYEVARRLALGAKDVAIARDLGVSVRTVAADIAALVATLGARNRVELVLIIRGGRPDVPSSP